MRVRVRVLTFKTKWGRTCSSEEKMKERGVRVGAGGAKICRPFGTILRSRRRFFLGIARLVSGEISKLRYVLLIVCSSRDVIISRYGSQKTKKIDSNLNREINDRMNDIGYLINDISCIFLILKSLSDDFN